jgi:hypothetical protein
MPPIPRRISDTALTALHGKLHDPHGCAGYNQMRVWLAEEHQGPFSYASVHAFVRYKLQAKPQRPRPSHAKHPQKPGASVTRPCLPCSPHSLKATRRCIRS